jgi:hypothetical protein
VLDFDNHAEDNRWGPFTWVPSKVKKILLLGGELEVQCCVLQSKPEFLEFVNVVKFFALILCHTIGLQPLQLFAGHLLSWCDLIAACVHGTSTCYPSNCSLRAG